MRIAVVGGTGAFGSALARQLVAAGHDVVLGSRDAGRAREAAERVGCVGATNADAVVDADLVVLAVAAESAEPTARELAPAVRSPVLCVASRLEFGAGGARPPADERSVAERVAAVLDVPVVAGLHSVAARSLAEDAPDEDVLVCGDDEDAKAQVLAVVESLVAGRALDAGPLAVARALEGMTAVIVNLNRKHKAHAGLRVTGLG